MKAVNREELLKAFDDTCSGECAICSHGIEFTDCGLIKEIPTFQAIPLDKVKKAREEILATNEATYAIRIILDELIESEGKNDKG